MKIDSKKFKVKLKAFTDINIMKLFKKPGWYEISDTFDLFETEKKEKRKDIRGTIFFQMKWVEKDGKDFVKEPPEYGLGNDDDY